MPSNPQPRVLYVDDDADSREMLSTLLKMSLIETTTVGTAAQALLSIQAEHFDLYLLDSQLPDLDGFELCRRIRDFDSATPILFFSGAAYETDKKRGIDAGADGYLVKPDLEGLFGSITQFVSPGKSAAPTHIIPAGREVTSVRPWSYKMGQAA
jgi:DNA-binding response OmpR family regulator